MGLSEERPTMAMVHSFLSGMLQGILDTMTSDWTSGNFLTMAKSGMLLNSTGETAVTLTEKFSAGAATMETSG